MFSRFSVFLAVPLLFGCAYALESTVQDLTIETPGAKDAICYAYVDGFRHRFHTPETLSIRKAHKDLIIDCLAPGNRRKGVTIPPEITKLMVTNISNGFVPGAAWDIVSGAAFKFPGVLEIDFTGIPVSAEQLPAHNNPDIRQPEDYDLEEFLPGDPRLNSDRYIKSVPLEKRVRASRKNDYQSYYVGTSPAPFSKGNLSDARQGVQVDPDSYGASQPSASTAPSPLYPGE